MGATGRPMPDLVRRRCFEDPELLMAGLAEFLGRPLRPGPARIRPSRPQPTTDEALGY